MSASLTALKTRNVSPRAASPGSEDSMAPAGRSATATAGGGERGARARPPPRAGAERPGPPGPRKEVGAARSAPKAPGPGDPPVPDGEDLREAGPRRREGGRARRETRRIRGGM